MQKKIIALAIASAMAIPAAALAEVSAYGQLNMAYESVDDGGDQGTVGTNDNARTRVSSTVSRLGFKGSDDLGDGLTAVWQMEGEVAGDTGGNKLFTRNTFAGLSGGFGTVVLGRHDTPYKMATRKIDVFADTIADNRSIMGNFGPTSHDARLSDVVAYLTPNFDGFTAAVAMVGKTDNDLKNDLKLTGLGLPASTVLSATSLSAGYARDNYTVSLANQTVTLKDKAVAGNNGDVGATKLAGTYAMDAFTVGLVYEMLTNSVGGGSKLEQNNMYVSGTYKVSDAGTVKLAYTMGGESKQGATKNKDSATQVALGYDHSLSKNTSVYALYTSVTNDSKSTNMTYGLSTSGSTGAVAAGTLAAGGVGNPTAIAIGVRTKF